MKQYRECPRCGAALDPGEVCEDCKKKTAPDAANIKSGKAELVNTPASVFILPDEQEDCKR